MSADIVNRERYIHTNYQWKVHTHTDTGVCILFKPASSSIVQHDRWSRNKRK